MPAKETLKDFFGRLNSDGNVVVLWVDGGEAVTRFDETMPTAWPVDSGVSAYYEHPNGIVLTVSDAAVIGIPLEDSTEEAPAPIAAPHSAWAD